MTPEELNHHVGLAVLEHGFCHVAVVDREFRVVLSNRAFAEAFGHGRGVTCHRLYKSSDERCERCVVADVLADGRDHSSVEEGISAGDTAMKYEVRAVPVVDDAGTITHVVLISSDVTRVTALDEALRQAEPLANVGLSTAGLAHTIKNILAGLEGGVYVVESGLDKGDTNRLRSGWRMVQDYVGEVSRLVKNLLDFARPRPPQREQVDLAELIDEIVRLYRAKAGASGIELSGSVEDGTPPIVADRASMHAVLANLVTNALDACTWDPDGDKHHTIAVTAAPRQGGGVRIAVEDNGKGISPEHQPKILVSCFSTKGMRGNGLGLLLTRQTVGDHGGTIDFASTPGRGTTFTIELPAAPDGEEP
jgi:signal transduction histidine kinase